MDFEHSNIKPDSIKAEWEGQLDMFSWLEFVCAIPQVLFVVTTEKENGQPNAAFQGWSSFTGESDEYFIIMSGLMKRNHTYQNIRREEEFCVNFLNQEFLAQCQQTVEKNDPELDEITEAGFTAEPGETIDAPRISEAFLKLECEFEWEKELVLESPNTVICGRVQHLAVDREFAQKPTEERYGSESFMFNLHNPVDPVTGEFFGSGIGCIEYSGKLI